MNILLTCQSIINQYTVDKIVCLQLNRYLLSLTFTSRHTTIAPHFIQNTGDRERKNSFYKKQSCKKKKNQKKTTTQQKDYLKMKTTVIDISIT